MVLSFRAKTILGIALIEIVMLAVLIVGVMRFLRDTNERQLVLHAEVTAATFAAMARDGVISFDLERLQSAAELLTTSRGIVFARILDARQQTLAQAGAPPFLKAPFVRSTSVRDAKDRVFSVDAPIAVPGTQFGSVQVGFDVEDLHTALASAQRWSWAIAALEIALVAFFSYILGGYLLRQITQFTLGAQQISEGKAGTQLQVVGHDEIAQATHAFNSMSLSILRSKENLELRVLEKTAELELAKDEAEAANKAKGQFLANMSHEIRTPMNAVLGMLQLVQKTALDGRQQDYVDKAQSAAKSLLGLLNDILDFSKMEAGKLQLDLHPFELEGLMRDLAVVLSGAQSDSDVEVIFEIDPALPPALRGDRLRMQQILINLAGNAVKFTRSGQVVIRLTERSRVAGESLLRVEVSDTGIGMSPEQQARIFESFTQAEASTTRHFGGTGLGLVISQRLVTLMGGHLQVESALGEGSRFWFDITLPVARSEPAASALPSLPQELRVLVVEDNPMSRDVLLQTLQGIGWIADGASSGQDGVEAVRRAQAQAKPYDVVLMDWRMPGMDGLVAASLIQQTLPNTLPPVIIMVTAFGREVLADTAEMSTAPFVDFLTKPVTPQQLVAAVQKAMANPIALAKPVSGATPVRALRLQGVRILLVEDNALNRQVATELLHAEGATVNCAEGGVQGVGMATAPTAAFDVIIMDVQMPDLDGLQATRRIRSHTECRQLPILAMTANASPADRRDCLAAGMDDHLAKPIDINELVDRLLPLLRRTKEVAAPDQSDVATPVAQMVESPDAILTRFGHKLDIYHMALSSFKAESTRLLTQLQQQVDNKQLAQAGATMHALKGMAATVGASALAQAAADLERQTRTDPDAAPSAMFSKITVAGLRDMVERSDALLAATMPPDSSGLESLQENDPPALSVEQWGARLQEIQSHLHAGSLRAIDLTQALLAETSGEEKKRVQNMLDLTEQLQFVAAEKLAQSLLEGMH